MTLILDRPFFSGSIETGSTILITGNEEFDSVMTMILGMPNLAGSIIACFLDNTVPGTDYDFNI